MKICIRINTNVLMSKKRNIVECDMKVCKRRKSDSLKIPVQIIDIDRKNKKWLIEWCDQTRTWENYDNVKDMIIFREWVESMIIEQNCRPSYIT